MTRRTSNWRLRNLISTPATVVLTGALALAALDAEPSPHRALVIWNASASAPIGFYRATYSRVLSRGRLVLVSPGPSLAAFASRRDYLPRGVPLVKRVAAIAGDAVCANGQAIFINSRFAAARLVADARGRPLPVWSGCRTLHAGEVFLLMPNVRASFDGRYFGPTPASQVATTLDPIWMR